MASIFAAPPANPRPNDGAGMTAACCPPESAKGFDLAVIGAGSAGFSAAIAAANLGARVALVGHGEIGGTCVNVGCVPSKTLIRAAESLHQAQSARRFAGIEAQAHLTDWAGLIEQKDALVGQLRQAKYADLLPQYPAIRYFEGKAQLTPDGVRVDGATIAAPKMVIATGASPRAPEIAGIDRVPWLDSAAAMALQSLPRSLLVIGAGYIGVELAQMFARAGVRVTLVCRHRLLNEAEPEISDALAAILRGEGIDLREGLTYLGVGRSRLDPQRIDLRVQGEFGPKSIEADEVLVAAGRTPNSAGFGLEELGVGIDAGGGVRVDAYLQTANPRIYAAGDVTGRHLFVYMAAYGARLAAENALNGNAHALDDRIVPKVVFTDPQLASVGLTEVAARRLGIGLRTSVLKLDQLPRALAARDTRGLIKLVAEAETGRLIGAHILAPEGADAIQTAALAIKFKMTAKELAETIFPYLTTVEGLKLAALGFEKDPALLSCCAS